MRVYLAGPYAARDKLRVYRDELQRSDIECTSSWLAETHEINNQTTGAATGLTDAEVDGHARMDLADIDRSDVLVLFANAYLGKGSASGGKHVETGYALARGRRVIVVGEPENVFHRLVTVERYDAWGLALHRLVGLHELGIYDRRPLRGYPA